MSNTAGTLVDVRTEAMLTIQAIKDGKMDIKTATEIRNQLNLIIDVSKTQVEYLKAIPMSIKEKMAEEDFKNVAGTFRDPNSEIEQTMLQIEANKKKPYEIGK
jgi:hypothetical protein